MNIQEQIKNLMDSFTEIKESVLKFAKPTLKFGEIAAKDVDGKETKWTFEGEMLAVGAAPTIEGTAVADGEYALESGMIAVIEGGLVKELAEPMKEGQENEQGYEGKFAAVETKFNAVQTTIENLSTVLGKIAEQMGSTLEIVSKFADQTPTPAEKPLNSKQVAAQKQGDNLTTLGNALKNLKK